MPENKNADRSQWMGLLARADETELATLMRALPLPTDYRIIRGPQEGLVMVRARAGGVGERFNMGEATVTRCSVEIAGGTVGHAYVSGRHPQQSEQAAVIDALMIEGTQRPQIEQQILAPLSKKEQQTQAERKKKAAATRVDFFTVVRGED